MRKRPIRKSWKYSANKKGRSAMNTIIPEGYQSLLSMYVTQKAISRIETGERVIPDYELLYFSDVFQISVLEFFKGQNGMVPQKNGD